MPRWMCSNSRFSTDTRKGKPHPDGRTDGSVFDGPVAGSDEGNTLWLEHVFDSQPEGGPNECFWFMWYDRHGNAAIKTSAAFSEADLRKVVDKLADFPWG